MMLFAFTITANAQEAKLTPNEDAAKKDVAALTSKVTTIDADMKNNMYKLMIMKYEMLAKASTPAAKTKVSDIVEHKIMAGLTKEQINILSSDPVLLKQLTH